MARRAGLGVDRGRSGPRTDSGSTELFHLPDPNSSGPGLLPRVRQSFSVGARHTGVGDSDLARWRFLCGITPLARLLIGHDTSYAFLASFKNSTHRVCPGLK